MSSQPSRQFNGNGHSRSFHNGSKHGARPHPTYVQSGVPSGFQPGFQPGLPNGGVMPTIPQHDPAYVTQYEQSYAEQYNPPPQQNYIYVQQVPTGMLPGMQPVDQTISPNMQPGMQQIPTPSQSQYVYTTSTQPVQQVYGNQTIPPPYYGPQPTQTVSQPVTSVQTMAPVQSKPSKPKKSNDSFHYKGVPQNLMYGLHKNCSNKVQEAAAAANNTGDVTQGIMFYRAEANKSNNGQTSKWKTPFLGQAIELSPSQVEFLVKFFNLTDDPFNYGSNKSSNNSPPVQPPVQSPVQSPVSQQQPIQMQHMQPVVPPCVTAVMQPGVSPQVQTSGQPAAPQNMTTISPQTQQQIKQQAKQIANLQQSKQSKQSKQSASPQMQQPTQPGMQPSGGSVAPSAIKQPNTPQPSGNQQQVQQPKKVTISQHALSPNVAPPGGNQPNIVVYTTYAPVPNLLDI